MSLQLLISIYENQYNQRFPFDTESSEIKYYISKVLNANEVLRLYEARCKNYYQHNPQGDRSYELFVNQLMKYEGDTVIIHTIIEKEKVGLVVTDDKLSKIVGLLNSEIVESNRPLPEL